jgi:hypothetical protein
MPADDRNLAAYLLEKKIKEALREQAQDKKDLSQTRYDVEGETLHSCFWTKSAAGYHMKETMHEFIKPNSPPAAPGYESRPKEMAEIGRAYHDGIQHKDKPDDYARILATSIVLNQCDAYIKRHQHDSMSQRLLAFELIITLKMSKNETAPGIDGLPYEFYKWLEIERKKRAENHEDTWNLMEILESLFEAIEIYGVAPCTDFNTGWMCPIYKGDRANIVNYRPVTLLNIDYKLMTKDTHCLACWMISCLNWAHRV